MSRAFIRKYFLGITIVVLVLAGGVYMLARSRAATLAVSAEPENGTVSSPAVTGTDTTASGGKYVAFTSSSSGLDPSGQPMPVGDIPGWKQIFADNFPTNVPLGNFPTAVSTKWGAYPSTWKDTSGNGSYNATKVVSIQNGVMNMYIHTESGVHYVAVPYPLLPGASAKNGQLYGRYAVRFKSDALHAYKTAWLLWPDSETWPRDGEIDFPEGNLDSTISAFMHRMNGTSSSDQDAYHTTSTYTSWHTAVTEWSAGKCTFILDGTVIGTSTSRVPSTPMHYVLQTETALDGSVPSDTTAGNVQVDWVAVYAPN